MLKQIGSYIKNNTTGLALIAAGVAGLGVLTACSGWSIRDQVKMTVPTPVRETTGAPAQVSVREAPYVREKFIADTTRALSQFDEAYAGADGRARFVEDLLNMGISAGQTAAENSGLPLGGFLALALGGLGGLLIEKPGTATRTKAREDAAWDEAVQQTRDLLLATAAKA